MTKIEWTHRLGTTGVSWNPVIGCTKISAGCKNCYAERMSKRLAGRFGYPPNDYFCPQCENRYPLNEARYFCEDCDQTLERSNSFDVTLHPDKLDVPLKWRKPRTVFVCSMGDLFHEDVYVLDIHSILDTIGQAKQHTFLVLTKRAYRMRELLNGYYDIIQGPLFSNLWLGVTVESPDYLWRVDELLQIPAAVRFASVEPMLSGIDLNNYLPWCNRCILPEGESPCNYCSMHPSRNTFLDWVICGAETGPGARPMELAWARDLRDQCKAASTPFFFKRASPGTETPPTLAIREWPEVTQ